MEIYSSDLLEARATEGQKKSGIRDACALDVVDATEYIRGILHFRPDYDEEDPSCSHPSFPPTPTRSDEVVPWNWLFQHLILILKQYPTGAPSLPAIIEDLQNLWHEISPEWCFGISRRLSTIDAVLNNKSVSLNALLEVSIVSVQLVPGTKAYILKLKDSHSRKKIEWYLHQKYYSLLQQTPTINAPLREGRTLRLTGLRMSTEGGKNRLLPTEYGAVVLSQEETFVTSTFTHRLANIATHTYPFHETFHLLVKVKSIKTRSTEAYRHQKETKVVLRDVQLDSSPFKLFLSQRGTSASPPSQTPIEATLILRDEKELLAYLFKEGDCLGISNPLIPKSPTLWLESPILEYGPSTLIYVIPMAVNFEAVSLSNSPYAKAHSSTRCYLPIDEEGNRDLKHYSHKLSLVDLSLPNMLNISVFGRIDAMGQNQPFTVNNKTSNRFVVRLEDDSGSKEITLWDKFGEAFVSACRPGQLVFIENATTSPSPTASGIMVLDCSEYSSAKFHNISTLKGLLTTPYLCKTVPLRNIPNTKNFICKATITAYHLPPSNPDRIQDPPLLLYHTRCGRDVGTGGSKGNYFYCSFCRSQALPEQTQFEYHLLWALKDGTGCVDTYATHQVNRELIGLEPLDFKRLTVTDREGMLRNVIGNEYLFSVSKKVKEHYEQKVKRRDGEEMRAYATRIDQLAPVNAVRTSQQLLSL